MLSQCHFKMTTKWLHYLLILSLNLFIVCIMHTAHYESCLWIVSSSVVQTILYFLNLLKNNTILWLITCRIIDILISLSCKKGSLLCSSREFLTSFLEMDLQLKPEVSAVLLWNRSVFTESESSTYVRTACSWYVPMDTTCDLRVSWGPQWCSSSVTNMPLYMSTNSGVRVMWKCHMRLAECWTCAEVSNTQWE